MSAQIIKLFLTLVIVLIAIRGFQGFIDRKCLYCICQVESNCNVTVGCEMDVGTLSCGPYQIKSPYWIDCGKPGSDWQTCATNKTCAETCIYGYMRRYVDNVVMRVHDNLTTTNKPTCIGKRSLFAYATLNEHGYNS
jgi:hypothetical protein